MPESFITDAADWVNSQPLRILVMGPGVTSQGFDKRQQILEYVRALNEADEVYLPEEAIERDETLSALEPDQAEEALVRVADAVVLLLSDDPLASGPLAEANQFLRPDLRDRFFVIEPQIHTSLMRSARSPYAFKRISRLDNNQRFSYTSDQLKSCTAIRDRIRKWLTGIRFEKRERAGDL